MEFFTTRQALSKGALKTTIIRLPITGGIIEPNSSNCSGRMSDLENETFAAGNSETGEPDLLETGHSDEGLNEKQEEFEDETSGAGTGNFSAVEEWERKREAQIESRDQEDREAKEKLREEAVKHIDDFYENYNRKKAQHLETVKQESEEFLKKKNEFFSQENTTTWDRVLQLINQDDADVLGDRDRSKFKEILQRLKGNANAPGA